MQHDASDSAGRGVFPPALGRLQRRRLGGLCCVSVDNTRECYIPSSDDCIAARNHAPPDGLGWSPLAGNPGVRPDQRRSSSGKRVDVCRGRSGKSVGPTMWRPDGGRSRSATGASCGPGSHSHQPPPPTSGPIDPPAH